MTANRPFLVTLICVVANLTAISVLIFSQMFYWNPSMEGLAWREAHPTSAQVALVLDYAFAAITLVTCYYMLCARNWARWVFAVVFFIQFAVGFVLMAVGDSTGDLKPFTYKGSWTPALVVYILALFVLWSRGSREYFYAAGRPWWKIEEEEEARRR